MTLEYSVAKSSLHALAKLTAYNLSKIGVRCNIVTPGNLMFEGSVWHRKFNEDKSLVEKYLQENVPGGRIGKPHDIFEAIQSHNIKKIQVLLMGLI